MNTTVQVRLSGDCAVRLWGLSSRERLQRMLRRFPHARLAAPAAPMPAAGDVLLLRADYLYDERVLRGLLDGDAAVVLCDPRDDAVVAARAPAERWSGAATLDPAALDGLARVYPAAWASGVQMRLRKVDRPWVAPVTAANRRRLEDALFSGAYKGVTDFITRGVWPVPARWATRLCVRLGLKPNHVTAASYVLAFLAGWYFWQGAYGWGLLAGWVMTFLDTVDGKLARVTVNSSAFGNIFDHALDLVHPPLWYLSWAVGLASTWTSALPLSGVVAVIFVGYIAGRLCEGAFQLMAPFSLFMWRPFDSLNRLVTARRNPNLVLLTLAWLAGHPGAGLLLVAAWTVASTLVLAARVAWAWILRRRGRPLQPWLNQVDLDTEGDRAIVRLFAPRSGLADG